MWDFIGWSRLGLGAASAAAQYVATHPQTSHNPINLDFLLDPLSKSEFLSFFLFEGDAPKEDFRLIDKMFDDGDLNSGKFR